MVRGWGAQNEERESKDSNFHLSNGAVMYSMVFMVNTVSVIVDYFSFMGR